MDTDPCKGGVKLWVMSLGPELQNYKLSYAELPQRIVADFGDSKLVGIEGVPSLAFVISKDNSRVPGPAGFPLDVRTRVELIRLGLCDMPATVVCPGVKLKKKMLHVISGHMNEISKQVGLPMAKDLYIRTRDVERRSHTFSSRGLLVQEVQSNQMRMVHAGGELDGEPVENLSEWQSTLGGNTHYLVHLDDQAIQKESLHVWYMNGRRGTEMVVGTGVPHARLLMRTGSYLRINNGDDLRGELEQIAEGEDKIMVEHEEIPQEGGEKIIWYRFERHLASSSKDAKRLAQMGLGYYDQLVSQHRIAQGVWGDNIVSEFRIYTNYPSKPHIMDVDFEF